MKIATGVQHRAKNTVVYQVPADLVRRHWHLYSEFVERALDHAHGELRVEDIQAMAEAEKVVVWAVQTMEQGIVGAAVTEEVEYARFPALRVIALGGLDFPAWGDLMCLTLVNYCRRQGLKRIEAFARRGMSRMLDGLGFKLGYVCLLKEIEDGETSGNNA